MRAHVIILVAVLFAATAGAQNMGPVNGNGCWALVGEGAISDSQNAARRPVSWEAYDPLRRLFGPESPDLTLRPVAPGEVVSLLGRLLADVPWVAFGGEPYRSLVVVNGQEVEPLYAGPRRDGTGPASLFATEVVLQIPLDVKIGDEVRVAVRRVGEARICSGAEVRLRVVAANPALVGDDEGRVAVADRFHSPRRLGFRPGETVVLAGFGFGRPEEVAVGVEIDGNSVLQPARLESIEGGTYRVSFPAPAERGVHQVRLIVRGELLEEFPLTVR